MLKATSHQRRGRMARIRSSFKSQSLSCEFQDITDEDLQELSQQVRPYRAVSFECNQISARGLRAMKHFCCEQLTLLNLNSNQIGSDGLKILSAFSLVHLKNASFARNRIEERGLMHLAKANWPCLQSLCLSFPAIKQAKTMPGRKDSRQ